MQETIPISDLRELHLSVEMLFVSFVRKMSENRSHSVPSHGRKPDIIEPSCCLLEGILHINAQRFHVLLGTADKMGVFRTLVIVVRIPIDRAMVPVYICGLCFGAWLRE